MRILTMFFAISLIICSSPVEADVYSWTDEDGIKRFSNRRPEGDVKNIQTAKEIPYDEEAAALRKAVEKEQQEKRLAEEQKQYWENMRNDYMQDRMFLERRLQETESQLEDLEQELEKDGNSDTRSSSYYPYWPVHPCWPNCSGKPDRPHLPRPPYARPPGLKPPHAKPLVYQEHYQKSEKGASKSGQHRKGRHQRSLKTSRPGISAPIASPVIR